MHLGAGRRVDSHTSTPEVWAAVGHRPITELVAVADRVEYRSGAVIVPTRTARLPRPAAAELSPRQVRTRVRVRSVGIDRPNDGQLVKIDEEDVREEKVVIAAAAPAAAEVE